MSFAPGFRAKFRVFLDWPGVRWALATRQLDPEGRGRARVPLVSPPGGRGGPGCWLVTWCSSVMVHVWVLNEKLCCVPTRPCTSCTLRLRHPFSTPSIHMSHTDGLEWGGKGAGGFWVHALWLHLPSSTALSAAYKARTQHVHGMQT